MPYMVCRYQGKCKLTKQRLWHGSCFYNRQQVERRLSDYKLDDACRSRLLYVDLTTPLSHEATRRLIDIQELIQIAALQDYFEKDKLVSSYSMFMYIHGSCSQGTYTCTVTSSKIKGTPVVYTKKTAVCPLSTLWLWYRAVQEHAHQLLWLSKPGVSKRAIQCYFLIRMHNYLNTAITPCLTFLYFCT